MAGVILSVPVRKYECFGLHLSRIPVPDCHRPIVVIAGNIQCEYNEIASQLAESNKPITCVVRHTERRHV